MLADPSDAVVTVEGGPKPDAGDTDQTETAVRGCALSSGVERLLGYSTDNPNVGTSFGPAAVNGSYAAVVTTHVVSEDTGGSQSQTAQAYDLQTGAPSYGPVTDGLCSSYSCKIGGIVVGADGVSAIETQEGLGGLNLQVLCAGESLCLGFDQLGQTLSSTTPTQGG